MKWTDGVALSVFAGFITTASLSAAPPPVAVQVSPSVAMAPATVFVTVTVEPDERNRMLMVEADSVTYYRSSAVTLQGEDSSRVKRFEFKNLPPGSYEVRVTIERSDGDSRIASTQYMVTG